MELSRSYQTTGQIMSGMFCRLCGRPTILASGLCPMCCNERYADKLYSKLTLENEKNHNELNKYSHLNYDTEEP